LLVSERHELAATEAHSAMATALLVAFRDGWRDYLQTAIDLARSQRDFRAEFLAFDTLFAGELVVGDVDRCLPLAEAALERANEKNIPFAADRFRVNCLFARMILSDNPRDVATEARELLTKPSTFRAREQLGVVAMHSLADCGRDMDAREVLAAAPASRPDDPTSRALRAMSVAEVHLAAGRAQAAFDAATECLDYPVEGFPAHEMAAAVRSWAARDLGIDPPPGVGAGFANAERFRVEAHAVDPIETDPRGAVALFGSALRMWGEHRSRYTLRCQLGLNAARFATGDVDHARDDASALADTCDALGFVALDRRARQLVRQHGGHAHRHLESRSGLVTRAEEELLELVLEGLTTHEISNRLYVAASTVDSSIGSAQTVLGSPSRLAAAIRVRAACSAPRTHPMRYTTDRALMRTVAARDADKAVVQQLREAPAVPWALSPAVVWTVDVVDEDSAAEALRGLLRGGVVLVWLCADGEWRDGFLADTHRLGDVELLTRANGPNLSAEQARLLRLVGGGRSVPEIATELNASRRTVERRLARVRRLFGVESNAELAALGQ
ncbi:MAG: LuxR C-terminal-related transcriptional regulator, partial [Acidimicrobiales bacterium]